MNNNFIKKIPFKTDLQIKCKLYFLVFRNFIVSLLNIRSYNFIIPVLLLGFSITYFTNVQISSAEYTSSYTNMLKQREIQAKGHYYKNIAMIRSMQIKKNKDK